MDSLLIMVLSGIGGAAMSFVLTYLLWIREIRRECDVWAMQAGGYYREVMSMIGEMEAMEKKCSELEEYIVNGLPRGE